jgi:hypothetical protein
MLLPGCRLYSFSDAVLQGGSDLIDRSIVAYFFIDGLIDTYFFIDGLIDTYLQRKK